MSSKINKNSNPFTFFDEKFDRIYKKIFEEVYISTPEEFSEFLTTQKTSYENDPIFQRVFELKKILTSTNSLKKFQIGHIKNLNDIFAIYIFSKWAKNQEEEISTKMQIVMLFRSFLNVFAWDIIQKEAESNQEDFYFNEISQLNKSEFTSKLNINYLPYLFDDFVGLFLKEQKLKNEFFKKTIKITFEELSKVMLEENLVDFVIKPLESEF
jgi:hypothetical protein